MSKSEESLCRKVASRRKRSSETKSKTPKKTKYKEDDDQVHQKIADPWIQNSFVEGAKSQSLNGNCSVTDTQKLTVRKPRSRHVNKNNEFSKNGHKETVQTGNLNNNGHTIHLLHNNSVETATQVTVHGKETVRLRTNSRAVPDLEVTFVNEADSESESIFSSTKNTSTPKLEKSSLNAARVPLSPCEVKPCSPPQQQSSHNSFNDSDSLFAELELPDNCVSPTALYSENSTKKHAATKNNTKYTPLRAVLTKRTNTNSSDITRKQLYNNTHDTIDTEIKEQDIEQPKHVYNTNETKKKSTEMNSDESHTGEFGFDSDDAILGDIDLQKYDHKAGNSTTTFSKVTENVNDFMGNDCESVLLQAGDMLDGVLMAGGVLDENIIDRPSNQEFDRYKLNDISNCDKTLQSVTFNSNSVISLNKHTVNTIVPVNTPGRNNNPSVQVNLSTAVTPVGGRSLKERLKQTLHNNAKVATPQSRAHKLQELRVKEAQREAELIKQQISEHDIGPFYGLPSKVQQLLEANRGITKLYDWQDECLTLPAVKEGKNLIYSLPTSGGKTLVAEVLIMRELLCKKKDAILVLPFVSIVQEKVRGMSSFAVELDFLVEEYAGSKGGFPPKKRRKKQSLYIATIEKANSLVNCFIEEGRIDNVGLVVVDELHMLGEGGSRGAILEMTLTKLRHVAAATQIVGMSATLNNIGDLLLFLQAELYTNDFRPVELTEYVKLDDTIYQIHQAALCPEDRLKHSRVVLFKYDRERSKHDPDHLAGLVLEVIPDHSCLVFCPTKKNCENVADLLCRLMSRDITLRKKTEKKALLKALLHDGNGEICPTLKRTIPYGVAYHHSGLTMDERKLIEEAYSEGTLCLLCCTSTLAAGVNLPAKRVILRSPYVGEHFLSRSQYKQMVGRAGRAGIDTSGESILVLQKKDKLKLLDLVSGPCDSCHSSLLYMEGKGIRSLLLTTIGLKITESEHSVKQFLEKTLCYVQNKDTDIDITNIATVGLQSLFKLGLIVETTVKSEVDGGACHMLEVTRLGRAVYKGSVDIDRGPQLLQDLCNAQESLCVANYLHLLYLVTPYDMVEQINPNWMTYLDEVSFLDSSEQKVASLVGVSESYVSRKATAQRIRKPVDEFPIKRFYLTLILYRLWKQSSIWDVSAKFKMPRGFIQQLLTGAAAFASCVTHFCQELEEFWAYQDLLTNFVKRLSFCVTIELIPLMEIPGVKLGRARQLFNSGYKNLQHVAYADPGALVQSIEYMPGRTAKQIVASAQMLLQEKADTLRDEAEEMVTAPINMPLSVDGEISNTGEQGASQASTTWGDMPTSQDI